MVPAREEHAIPLFQEYSSFPVRQRRIHDHWSNPKDHLQARTPHQHVYRRPLTEYHVHAQDFTLTTMTDDGQSWNNECPPPGMVRSITSMDLRATEVSGNFFARLIMSKGLFPKCSCFSHSQSQFRARHHNTSASCSMPVVLNLNATLLSALWQDLSFHSVCNSEHVSHLRLSGSP